MRTNYKNMLIKKLGFFVALLLLITPIHFLSAAEEITQPQATIFYSDACGSCGEYYQETLIPFLEEEGIPFESYDYVNDLNARKELVRFEDELLIPFELRSHFMTFFSDGVVFAGHIDFKTMLEVRESKENLPKTFVIFNDQMQHGDPDMNSFASYALWPSIDGIYETDISPVLENFEAGDISTVKNSENQKLLGLVIVSGLMDSLNPCAFAVLLLLLGFLYAIKRSRRNVLALGFTYIFGIFLAYVGIGIGILKALSLSDTPHFFARVASIIVITIGVYGIIRVFFPKLKTPFKIPDALKPVIQSYMYKATFPTALIAGLLVGLCTFPCSGGIYVAVLGLLNTSSTRIEGGIYLLLYNLMFVLPLIIVLWLSSNKHVVKIVQKQKSTNKKIINLVLNIGLILISIIILLFYV